MKVDLPIETRIISVSSGASWRVANLTALNAIPKFTTYTKFFEKPTNYNSAILVRTISTSSRKFCRAANPTVLYMISKFTTYTKLFEKSITL